MRTAARRASDALYRARHAEQVKAARARWRAEHRAEIRRYNAAYVEKRDYSSTWAAAHPERKRLNWHKRQARKRGNGVFLVTARDWEKLVRRFDGTCAYCGTRTSRLEQEHVIPLVRGGRHSIGNLLPACKPCNTSKHDKFITEWRHSQEKTK